MAAHVCLGAPEHPLDRPSTHHFTYRSAQYGLGEDGKAFFHWRGLQKVEVDHDVWIGHGAVVLAGVRIGRGAVVGAGSVVTRDVPPYTVVAGVPTRPIRRRFPEGVVRALERTRRWDRPHELLKECLDDFRDLRRFLLKYARKDHEA
ncbi:hypothetical protein TthHB5008_b22890 (plasmid) [Thermus thermophilus]|nr:hypothetical protein TthHB5002_b22040 [Thermus thermophilus]BCQ01519.1 hypothetical protein TthHB5008_b22890 [Thermus thermophilus]